MDGGTEKRTHFEGKALTGGSSEYRGLRIFAPPGLHARVAEIAHEQFPARARILDLGAGTGALSARLADAAFASLPPISCPTTTRRRKRRSSSRPISTASSSSASREVLPARRSRSSEHLEHPRDFLRRVAALLAPGGRLIVTTPNPASPVSKARFLRTGYFQWFTEEDRRDLGHVSPFTPRMLGEALTSVGLIVMKIDSFGDPRERVLGWWKLLLLARIFAVLARGSGDPEGDLLIAIAEKPREEARA